MAGSEILRGDVCNGLPTAKNGNPDGMMIVHIFHEHLEDLGVRIVPIHVDLLADDALLLLNHLLREVGGGDEFQQKIQTFPEILRAGEVIGGHIVAGEGVGDGTQSGKFCGHIPAGQVEHFMLQIVGNTGGDGPVFSVQRKIRVDGTEVGDEIAELFGKAGAGYHSHGQTVGKDFPVNLLAQLGVVGQFHISSPPLRNRQPAAAGSLRRRSHQKAPPLPPLP